MRPYQSSLSGRTGGIVTDVVVDDPVVAARLTEEGGDVVLTVAVQAEPVAPAGPGRLAVFVADGDPTTVAAAAAEMADELFGRVSALRR